jgi:hypothetical protein
MATNSVLTEVLNTHRGRHVVRHGAIWRLDGSSRQAEACKADVLAAVCRSARPFVHYEDSPVGLLEGAAEVVPGVWQLPLGASGPVVLEWLYMGNWQLYVRSEPLVEVPDLCRASDAEVEAFVRESGASVVIDSFHDDVSWVVACGDGA